MSPGERLRARLIELGWKQRVLVDAIGASASDVSRWISGKKRPSLDEAFAIERSPIALPADIWLSPASTTAEK